MRHALEILLVAAALTVAFNLYLIHQLRKVKMTATNVAEALAEVQAAVAAESTEIGQVVTYLQGIPALIAAAVAQAGAAGATPEQLAAFDALAAQVTTDTGNLTSSLAAAPK